MESLGFQVVHRLTFAFQREYRELSGNFKAQQTIQTKNSYYFYNLPVGLGVHWKEAQEFVLLCQDLRKRNPEC